MKAAVNEIYGPPEVIQVKDVPEPSPGDDEILVKVFATTVNRTDCGFLRGRPFIVRFFSGLFKPKHPVLGNEFAGSVIAVGKRVKDFRPGDKVFGYDDTRFGAHAEYMVINQGAAISLMPSEKNYYEVAPSTEGGHYALECMRAIRVSSQTRLLIYGATGAIGSASVQLAKYYGAHVTAMCGPHYIDLIKSLGAVESQGGY